MADSSAPPASHRPTPRGATLGLALLALLALLVHLEIMLRRTGCALFTFDSAEYALAGRMLARTGHLATPFAHPALLSWLPGPPFPLVVGHPLVPILDALAFALGGARPALTLVPAAAAYLAGVLLTAALARRASASRAVPWIAAGAFALSPTVLRFALEGLSELPFVALFTAALVLLWDLADRPRPRLLGVVLGLAHLTRPVVVPLLPVWLLAAWFLSPVERRGRTLAGLLVGFVPFAALLAIYKWLATGNPLADVAGLMLLARLSPELTIARLNRTFPAPSPWSTLAAHPGALVHKLAAFAPAVLYAGFTRAGRLIGALAALRLVMPGARRERIVQLAVVGFAVLLAMLTALTVPDPRMLLPLLPAFFVLGIDELHRIARARGLSGNTALALCGLIALGSSVAPTLQSWRQAWSDPAPFEGRFREAEWRTLGEGLGRVLPRDGLVASDAAPWVAWYADRDVTLVPAEVGMLEGLGHRVPIRAIVLTNEWLIDQPGEEAWRGWYEGTARDPRWMRADSVAAGRLKAIVFLARPRP